MRHAAYIQGEVHGYIIHDEDHAAVGFFLTLTWPSGSSTRERAPKSEHLPDTALSALALRVYISTRAREEEREREHGRLVCRDARTDGKVDGEKVCVGFLYDGFSAVSSSCKNGMWVVKSVGYTWK